MWTNEQNHQTLQNALYRLPTYEPSPEVWQRIDNQIESENAFHKAIDELPSYLPPVAVWERISEELAKPAQVRRLRPAWWSAAAAAVLVLAGGTYFWYHQTPEPVETVQVIYTQVDMPHPAVKPDWDEDDALMQEVVEAFAQKATFVQSQANQSLLSEWEELNTAKTEIKAMLAKYGNDADLIRTIADIERQRSTLIKQMATEI